MIKKIITKEKLIVGIIHLGEVGFIPERQKQMNTCKSIHMIIHRVKDKNV
jgi:hypothetical protein